MAYKKIKSYEMSELELRQLWRDTYCAPSTPIYTFDGILVKFYDDMFDHAFYESDNRKTRDKSILSYNRLEKMLWIKDCLLDSTCVIKQGWNRDKKIYENNRRVALIKGNYIVIIALTGFKKAKFITAYQILEDNNLSLFISAPDWIKEEKYVD